MKNIFVDNTVLTKDKIVTFLTEDVVFGGSTFRIQNIVGFEGVSTSSGQIVCIGEIGGERTELLRTSNTSGYNPSQAYKEVTLRDTLTFDHPQDTPVYIIDWNRIQLDWASSVAGSKSTMFAYPVYINPTQTETLIKETTQTNGFYFTKFNETIGNTNSDYSDAIPFAGYDDNMVASIKQRALDDLGEEVDGVIITNEYLNQCLWEARREYHEAPGKRPFRRKFGEIIGTALTGSYRIELPTTVEKSQSAENIYGVRIGTQQNMTYYDKKSWDFDYRSRPHTFLTTAYTIGNQDLYLSNVRDFADSGSVQVEGTTIGYSAKSNTGGTMRINSAGAWNTSVGSDVFQNTSYGLPTQFTVFADPGGSSYIYYNRPLDTIYVGQNIYLDYYRTLVGFDSDADVLDEPKYDMFIDYLKFKIKERRSKGNIAVIHTRTGQAVIADADYQEWNRKKGEALATEHLETDIRIFPDINNYDIPA